MLGSEGETKLRERLATFGLLYGSRPERGVLGSLYAFKLEYSVSPCL